MPTGILLLDKPRGLSSNAALQRVRALFGRVKAGHVGSLDPLASGMLPVCLGEATKVAGEILAGRKRYRFTIGLGAATETGDVEGEITARAPVPPLAPEVLGTTLAAFLGRSRQIPPMYSALKRGGQPLYRLARAGITVEREARTIELFELQLIGQQASSLELEVLCSTGTYVRVLAQDLAAALGTAGHVTALRRLYVEPFAGQPMHTLESLASPQPDDGPAPLLPADWPLRQLPAVHLAAAQAQRVLQGQRVPTTLAAAAQRVRLYDDGGRFLGIGAVDETGLVQPRRLINLPP